MVKSRISINALAIALGLVLLGALSLGAFSGTAEALEAGEAELLEVTEEATVVDAVSGPRYLADGTYVFNVDKDRSLLVDVAGSSKKAGAKVVMAKDTASKSQQWVIAWDEQNQAYRIKNAKSGLYLTAKAAKAGKKMISQAKLSTNNKKQLWKLEKDGKGYRFVSRASSSVALGTANGAVGENSYVTTQTSKSKKTKFYVLPVDKELIMPKLTSRDVVLDQSYVNVVLTSKTGIVLGIYEDGKSADDAVKLAKSSGSQSQKWCLKAVDADEGLYAVVNLGSGMALQVGGKGRHLGTEVVQGVANVSKSELQQWWVRVDAKGRYTLTSRYNGLTLRSGGAKAGSGVMLMLKSASNRFFKFDTVAPLDDGYYQLSTVKKPALSLGVAGGSSSANKQLKVSNNDSTLLWQKFTLQCVNAAENTYAIRSVSSNRYIGEVSGKIVQGTFSASDSQQWEIVWKGSGFVLKNKLTGNYLTASGSVKNGAKLVASAKYKPNSAKLVFTKCRLIEDGTYFMTQGSNAKKVMGIDQSVSKNEKAKVGVFRKANAQNLKFNVSYVGIDKKSGNEVYKIANTYSGKYLTASGSSLYQKKKSKSKAQNWIVFVTSKGLLAFKNASTGKAMSFGTKGVSTASYNAKKSISRFQTGLEATSSLTPEQLRAYDMINATFSNTNYAITADLSNHRVRVWKRANASSPWTLKYDWICSNGAWATPTPAVNVLSTGAKRFENPMYRPDGTIYGSSFWYMTYIADGKYFHTPLYRKGSMTKYSDARMGRFISHGCVRLQTNNAIWIYKNIKRGTRIITYY